MLSLLEPQLFTTTAQELYQLRIRDHAAEEAVYRPHRRNGYIGQET
jgi:hypothetical protein